MTQIPKGRLVKVPYKPICRDCAIYFSITVSFGSDFVSSPFLAQEPLLLGMTLERLRFLHKPQ